FSGLGIRSDAGVALQQISDDIRSLEPVTDTGWHGKTAEQIVQHLKHQIAGRLAEQDLEHEQHVMTAIRNAVSNDAVTFWGMTIAEYGAWNTWDDRSGGMHSDQCAGGIGYAFPADLGGSIGFEQRVLAVSGDGSAIFSIAELAAAKQHNVQV